MHNRPVMPQFYFHLHTPTAVLLDDHGLHLADLDAVAREADLGARSLMADEVRLGRPLVDRHFEVTDHSGRLVLHYPLNLELKTA